MGLLGSFSNRVIQDRLQGLAERLERLAASDAMPQPTVCAYQRNRPGFVVQAVMRVLDQAEGPMRPQEIHEALGPALQAKVSYRGIVKCLAEQVQGSQPRVERTARGLYRLTH